MTESSITVRVISTRGELLAHHALMQGVWGVSVPLVSVELLTAIAHRVAASPQRRVRLAIDVDPAALA